jgi:hypothetical protein
LNYSQSLPFFPASIKYLAFPKEIIDNNRVHLPPQLLSLILLSGGKVNRGNERRGEGRGGEGERGEEMSRCGDEERVDKRNERREERREEMRREKKERREERRQEEIFIQTHLHSKRGNF